MLTPEEEEMMRRALDKIWAENQMIKLLVEQLELMAAGNVKLGQILCPDHKLAREGEAENNGWGTAL